MTKPFSIDPPAESYGQSARERFLHETYAWRPAIRKGPCTCSFAICCGFCRPVMIPQQVILPEVDKMGGVLR